MARLSLIPLERIQTSILVIRDERVILDSDLASLYGVTTKRLNEQVRRNRKRFPDDFMFELLREEKDEVVANCDHLRKLISIAGLFRKRLGRCPCGKPLAFRRSPV
jgi:hypothetical protein